MKQVLRVKCVSFEIKVGNIDYNAGKVIEEINSAKGEGVDLLVFPESTLTGKTLGSFIHYGFIIDKQLNAIEEIAKHTKDICVCVSIYDKTSKCVLIYNEEIITIKPEIAFSFADGTTMLAKICEPDKIITTPPADVNILMGGFAAAADETNPILNACKVLAKTYQNIVVGVYGNAGESTTHTVYAVCGCVCEADKLLANYAGYSENSIATETDLALTKHYEITTEHALAFSPDNNYRLRKIPVNPYIADEQTLINVCEIQTASLIKRLGYTGLKKVILGVSGGLDSAVALMVCVNTFNKLNLPMKNIICISMPGMGSTNTTQSLAQRLAKSVLADLRIIPIKDSVTKHLKEIGHNLTPDATFENAQARERTQILMDIANMEGALLLGTGDLSEAALGFCTFNGDHMAMYNINSGVPKTVLNLEITLLSEKICGKDFKKIAVDICAIPPSPELLPFEEGTENRQDTQKQVGPYELTDFYLYYIVKHKLAPGRIIEMAQIAFGNKYTVEQLKQHMKLFADRLVKSSFKRNCSPDGVKIFKYIDIFTNEGLFIPSDADIKFLF